MKRLTILLTLVLAVGTVYCAATSRDASPNSVNQDSSAQSNVPQSLQEKMHRLETLVHQLQEQNVDMQPVGELMQGYQSLVQQKKFTEAEALLDRALKMAGDLAPAAAKQ